MDAQEYINMYGGKLRGWFFLKDIGGFERNLLPLFYVPPDMDVRSLDGLLPDEISNNWILRASHPNDHEGLVDILDSPKVIEFDKPRNVVIGAFKTNIKVMRGNTVKPEVIAYNEYEGQKYDGQIRVGIQPLNPGNRGSIIEHPHERGTYLIDLVTREIGLNVDSLDRIVVAGNKIDEGNSYGDIDPRVEDLARKIVELYKRVRETSFINQEYSFQMEFGVNRGKFTGKDAVLFYQARPFLKFEEPRFEMDENKKYGCFGMTDEGGRILPVVKTISGEGVNNIPQDFAWTIINMTAKMSPKTVPRNIGAFIPRGLRAYSLEHNSYRWVRKAKVSILDNFADIGGYRTGDKIRIVSNGLYYRLEKAA